jgi:hypothetical protein
MISNEKVINNKVSSNIIFFRQKIGNNKVSNVKFINCNVLYLFMTYSLVLANFATMVVLKIENFEFWNMRTSNRLC